MMQSMSIRLCFVVSSALIVGGSSVAQSADAGARLRTATELSSLEMASEKPWRLNLDVTVFDETGKNPKTGTVEIWHDGSDERRLMVFGTSSRTELRREGKFYRGSTGEEIPYEAIDLADTLVHPGPELSALSESVPDARKEKFGKVEFDCIMLSQPIKGTGAIPLGLFPTYCLDPGGVIRTTYDFGGRTAVVASIGTFLGHKVPMQLDVLDGQVKTGSAKVTSLTSYTPDPNDFVPTDEMSLTSTMARISGGVESGLRISFVQPVYPQSMKANHVSGTVVLNAIIGRDGHVHRLRPMSAPDPEFVISAIAAVRKWMYKPYLLNGEPTEVETTITVNYQIQ
jgi:TonB family protein